MEGEFFCSSFDMEFKGKYRQPRPSDLQIKLSYLSEVTRRLFHVGIRISIPSFVQSWDVLEGNKVDTRDIIVSETWYNDIS